MLTEKTHAGGFIISEADGHLSRDNGTLISGQNLEAGAVLGKITTGGKYTAWADAASDGSQTVAGILYAKVDASAGDAPCCVINKDAEVIADELVWPTESPPADTDEGIAELLLLGIKVR